MWKIKLVVSSGEQMSIVYCVTVKNAFSELCPIYQGC